MDTMMAVEAFKKAADIFRADATAEHMRRLQIKSRSTWSAIKDDAPLEKLPSGVSEAERDATPDSKLNNDFVKEIKKFIEITRDVLEEARKAAPQVESGQREAYSYYLAQCASRQALAETFLDQGMAACNEKEHAQGKRFDFALKKHNERRGKAR